jgi:hypothetical protein
MRKNNAYRASFEERNHRDVEENLILPALVNLICRRLQQQQLFFFFFNQFL